MLALALVLSSPFFIPSDSYATSKFRDVSGHWAEGFITRASNNDVISGYPNGRFYPDKSVTRAEFVTMVNNAFGINIDTDNVEFKDVTYDKWYYNAVATAATAAYISSGAVTFRPDSAITRQEAAVMLSNILPNYKEKGNLKSYRDYRLITADATTAWEKMTGQQYFGAYNDGRLHPADPLSRAQAAKILCDILDNETIVTRRTVIDEDKTTLTGRIYTDDVTIDEDLGEGSATIDNCVILGKLYVEGGGSQSVTINNSRVASVVMDKEDSAVRLVTKGTTVIPKLSASQKSILQTAGKGGYGILDVTVNKYADVTLKGNFPVVTIAGSTGVVSLESGKIDNLTITGSGKYSDITLTGKAQLAQATVNAECYFHGEGVITQMYINSDNVTYETKPKKMIVGTTVDRAEEEGNEDVDVTFKPKSKATSVDVDTNITLTFVSSMKLADGKAITAANIKDFVSLKLGSRNGDDVEFTASINSARKIITIDPVADLSTSTKYYVILKDEALINNGETKNDSASSYFTTSSKGGATSATFSPANGATGVSASTGITIKFKEDVVKLSDAGEVTAAYLQECVQLKSGGASGSNVTFTASISSSDTITITPTGGLTAGTAYYVAVVADKLKTKDGGKTISASSATWTVASSTPASSAATLSTLTVAPHSGSNMLTGFSASTSSYSVTVPFGTTSVDVTATAASGTAVQINGVTTTSTAVAVAGSSTTTISVISAASGMTTTTYTVSVQVAGNTTLSAISINGVGLLAGPDTYSATVPLAATNASISVTAADPNATITIGSSTGTGSCAATVSLGSGSQTVTFTVRSNLTTRTYTVYFSRLAI
jgi:hypothetical protein